MAPTGQRVNLLAAGARVWQDCASEFEEARATAEPAEGVLIPPEELAKVTKWVQHTVTKYGASASVVDGKDREKALRPIAEEVIKAFSATIGTLLSMKRGSGVSSLKEIRQAGSDLAAAMDVLGACEPSEVAQSSGKVLDRVAHVKKLSTQNRSAVRRVLLRSLTMIRDAHRELREALAVEASNGDAKDGSDSEAEFDDCDEALEGDERRVVEALVALTAVIEEVLKETSSKCVPLSANGDGVAINVLEVAAKAGLLAAEAVDSIAASACGGLEVENLRKDIQKLYNLTGAIDGASPASAAALAHALKDLESAAIAAEEAEAE